MEIYLFILALLCLGFIHSFGEGWNDYNSLSIEITKEGCNNAISEDEKKEGYEKYFYIRWKRGENENKYCESYTGCRFEHLYFKDLKYYCGSEDFNIECGSNYFKLSLLSLMFLFFSF